LVHYFWYIILSYCKQGRERVWSTNRKFYNRKHWTFFEFANLVCQI